MSAQEGAEQNGSGSASSSQSDSRLKSKKPPSLTIAIPPSQEESEADACRQVGLLSERLGSSSQPGARLGSMQMTSDPSLLTPKEALLGSETSHLGF